MARVRIKDLLIAENYASAAVLSNQSKRNELNVFTFTWFPFYLKPYKDFVWRICIDPSQWLWGEGLKLKVLIPMFSQNNFHLRWYTLTTIIQSIFIAWKRREGGGRWGFWGSLSCQGNLGGISRPQQSIKGVVCNKIDYQLTANDGGGVGHKNITCPYWGSGTFCWNMTKIPQVPHPSPPHLGR